MRRLALALVAALLAVLTAAPGAAASPSQEAELMDDPLLVYGTDAQVAGTLDVLRSMGVDRIRVSVFWNLLAPRPDDTSRPAFDAADPRSYSPAAWDRYDRLVVGARQRGIGVYFTITGPGPLWASSQPSRGQPQWNPNPGDFRGFVTALGRRYSGSWADERPESPPPPAGGLLPPIGGGGSPPAPPEPIVLPRVRFWSAWNEPTQGGWLRPQALHRIPTSPWIYRRLQDAAYAGLQDSGHGHDTYLLAETAPRGSRTLSAASPMRPLLFLRELYCLDRRLRSFRGRSARIRGCPTNAAGRRRFPSDHPGLFRATGWAHHPYAFEVAPTVPDPNRDDVTIARLSRLTRTLDGAFRHYGVRRRLSLWLTEYGYQTKPPDPFLGVSWAQQAAYLNKAEEIAYRNPRVKSIAQFLLVDDGPNRDYEPGDPRYWGSTFQTGLLTHDGDVKPAFAAWQRTLVATPGTARPGQRLRLLGQLRPAPNGARLEARLEFRRRGSRRWTGVRRVATRSFRNYVVVRVRARSSGSWRLAWRNPSGGRTLYSRAARVTVSSRRR